MTSAALGVQVTSTSEAEVSSKKISSTEMDAGVAETVPVTVWPGPGV